MFDRLGRLLARVLLMLLKAGSVVLAVASSAVLLTYAIDKYMEQVDFESAAFALTRQPNVGTYAALAIAGISLRLLLSDATRRFFSTFGKASNSEPERNLDHVLVRSESAARLFQDTWPNRYKEIITALSQQLAAPHYFFPRVKEHVELSSNTVSFESSLLYVPNKEMMLRIASATTTAPDSSSPRPFTGRLVQVIQRPKGDLLDGFTVAVQGNSVSTLTHELNHGAIFLLLRTLFDLSVPDPSTIVKVEMKTFEKNCEEAWKSIVFACLDSQKRNPSDAIEKLGMVLASGTPNFWADRLQNLIFSLSEDYIILIYVECANYPLRIQVCHREDARSHASQKVTIRALVGLRTRRFRFELARPRTCKSYHFSLRTPVGMYLYQRGLVEHRGTEGKASKPIAGTPLLNSSRKNLHAYCSRYEESNIRSVSVSVELRERPPALLEVSLLLSALLAFSTVLVGLFHDEVFGKNPGAAPTLLFSLPLVLIGWLFTRMDSSSLARLSATSMCLIAWLALNSTLTVLVATLKVLGVNYEEEPTYDLIRLWHPTWAILMSSCVLHLGLTLAASISRALRYQLAPTKMHYP